MKIFCAYESPGKLLKIMHSWYRSLDLLIAVLRMYLQTNHVDIFKVSTEHHFHGAVQVQATVVKVPLSHFLYFTLQPTENSEELRGWITEWMLKAFFLGFSVCVCACNCFQKTKEDVWSSRSGLLGGCEPCEEKARNWTLALYKSSKCP